MNRMIQFFGEDVDAFKQEIAEETAQKVIAAIFKQTKPKEDKEEDELLTTNETLKRLKITSSTLWMWRKKGVIQAYGIEHRVYFKSSDIDRLLKPIC